MKQYKVVTERDSRFRGRFDPEVLEAVLNDYAKEGWSVIDAFLASNVWKTIKAEIIVRLERDAAT